MKFFLYLIAFFLLQHSYAQFDDYTNTRMVKYFEDGNEIVSISGGKALDNFGSEINARTDFFIRDGLSWGGSVTGYINHPDFLYVGIGENIRGYFFHYKIRPFIEVSHDVIIGQDLVLNLGTGGGIAIAGITSMLGIEFMINYEIPYVNFSDNERHSYLIPTVGINLQW